MPVECCVVLPKCLTNLLNSHNSELLGPYFSLLLNINYDYLLSNYT